MKHLEFKKLLDNINKLSRSQDRLLKEELKRVDKKKIVSKSLETPLSKIKCIHCKSRDFIRWGYQSDMQRYKCKKCNKTFNSLSGTPLAKLKRKGHWLEYSKCIILGKSIRKSAALCEISNSTSFRWRHRFLKASNLMDAKSFRGIVEFYDQKQKLSFKGSRNIPKKYINKRPDLTVLYCKDRSNNSKSVILKEITEHTISNKLSKMFSKDLLFCSDNQEVYHRFANKTNLRHGYINLSNKEYVKKNVVHINTINQYYEDYNIWKKRFNGVATKYLKNYLSWYRTLDEFRYNIKAISILLRAKGIFIRPTKNENILDFP